MNRLISIELRKLRTTPALWITTAITLTLTLASVVANIELAGTDGAPALGSPDNVDKVLAVERAVVDGGHGARHHHHRR